MWDLNLRLLWRMSRSLWERATEDMSRCRKMQTIDIWLQMEKTRIYTSLVCCYVALMLKRCLQGANLQLFEGQVHFG